MLIDAGPTDAGPTVVNYLKTHGVTNLDVVVATHLHEDHIGGMVDVLNAFPVGLYVDNGETTTTKTYENVMSTLQKNRLLMLKLKQEKQYHSLMESQLMFLIQHHLRMILMRIQ